MERMSAEQYRASDACVVPGCEKKKHRSPRYCSKHANRFYRYGDPLAGRVENGEPMRWLASRVGHQDDGACLLWPFGRLSNGYGCVVFEGKRTSAHRAMCRLEHGPPGDPSMQAAHSCGKGHLGCVNPRHLRWATPVENARDCIAHGTDNRGERNMGAKLTEEDVRRIRALLPGRPQAKVAEAFGISRSTIGDIAQRRTWAWL